MRGTIRPPAVGVGLRLMAEGALSALQMAPATVAGVLYAVRVHRLRGTSRAVRPWRQGCFYGGIALQVVTLAALGGLADELFVAHMTEHLLLADVGALLLVLGLTGPVLAPVLRLPGLRHLAALTHPVAAFALWTADLWLWHVPSVHDAAVRHAGLHALQHTAFVACGVLMWMALLGPLPKPAWFGNAARLGYVAGVRVAGALLGNALLFGGHSFYAVYAAGERAHGISPSTDQFAAGAVMMVEGSLVTIALLGWLFFRWAREGEERQELLEIAQARGVALTEARAGRAVAAGRGRDLRRRLESG
jgi:cytochrome c oxidase assembly factor CtaG